MIFMELYHNGNKIDESKFLTIPEYKYGFDHKKQVYINETEGVLTLRKLIELSEEYLRIDSDYPKNFLGKDGASQLANFLFEQATDVNFFVGQAVNEAHSGLPIDSTLKFKLVEKLSENLKSMGKRINVKYY